MAITAATASIDRKSTLNRDPDTALERAYAPWFDMEAEPRARDLPLLSLESALPASKH